MRIVLAAIVVAWSSTPSFSEECRYVSGFDLGSVTFLDGAAVARFDSANGTSQACSYMLGDEAGNRLTCPGSETMVFSFAGKELGDGGADYLVLMDHLWYTEGCT